jgi:integrase
MKNTPKMAKRTAPKAGRPRTTGSTEKMTYKGHEITLQLRVLHGLSYYRARYYQAGERKERTLRADNKKEAMALAQEIIDRLPNAQGSVLFPADQAAAIQAAADQLRSVNRTLLASVTEYVQAIKMLPPGHTLAAAIQDYLANLNTKKLDPIDFADLVKKYLKTAESSGMRPRSYRDVQDRLTRATQFLKGPVAQIDADAVQDFLDSIPKVGNRTRNNYRGALVGLFTFGKKRGHLPLDRQSAPELTGLYKKESEEIAIYTPKVIRTALEKLPARWTAYLAIGAFSGLRQSELHSLDWSNVHVDTGHLVVTSAKAKTKSRRAVPMQPNLVAWLKERALDHGPVAPAYKSTNTLARAFSEAWDDSMPKSMKRATNALRHSFGTYRLAVNNNADQVALEMGNSPKMIFEHYRAVTTPDDKVVTKDMGEEFFSITP